jgi:hypothetical protein
MERMDISTDDAVAHLAKWRDAETTVRAVYTNVTGNDRWENIKCFPAAIKLRAADLKCCSTRKTLLPGVEPVSEQAKTACPWRETQTRRA